MKSENSITNKNDRIQEIESRLAELPKGSLVYKIINGKAQPYLQYVEDGKTKSFYIKIAERDRILLEIEEKKLLQEELKRLSSYSAEINRILIHNPYLDRKVGIGWQQFDMIREQNLLYVDKTHFIKEWWESMENVMMDALEKCNLEKAVVSVHLLSELMYRYHGKKVILLIDEYDTPLQDAYLEDYFDSLVKWMSVFLNHSCKANSYVQRALMTGITSVANNSLFSDMNHLVISTLLTNRYTDCFGFTEQEVSDILVCQNVKEMEKVKAWYDGFVIGGRRNIYNPWSIMKFVSEGIFQTYWVNTSGNELVSLLIAKGNNRLKSDFEILLNGGSVRKQIDESLAFQYLNYQEDAIWSLLVATGYLKVENLKKEAPMEGDISITNYETLLMFENIAKYWFSDQNAFYDDFLSALMCDQEEELENYLGELLLYTTSFHDPAGRKEREPERFYHGLVLGLIASCRGRYEFRSNRESGFGRYDIMMFPKRDEDTAKIIEFKVRNPKREIDLDETIQKGFEQIESKKYDAELKATGISEDRICKYVFAFEGKEARVELRR